MLVSGRLGVPQAGAAGAAVLALRQALGGIAFGGGQLYESALFVADYEAFLEVGGRARSASGGWAPGVAAAPSQVTVEGVGFTYPGARRAALHGVDLGIRAGEVVALVGENGSGKTTLAKLLAGLYRPTEGRVCWDGVDLGTLDPAGVRRQVAVVFQDFERYALTAYENVAFGDVTRLGDAPGVRTAAERADADAVVARLPQGWQTPLGRVFDEGADLSVGQWQRIALARAFFRDAPLVILDEPSAALDARAEHALFTRIRELYAGRTVVLISHRFSTVRTADRILVLHRGRVLESGTHDELMRLGGRYAELFTLQAQAYLEPS
jgi:ATP-binding cassette subfamily B protein